MTVDITIRIQQDENSTLNSYLSELVMCNISFSSTVETELEEFVQTIKNLTFRITLPYNMEVNMSIDFTLCGLSTSVPFNCRFYYS